LNKESPFIGLRPILGSFFNKIIFNIFFLNISSEEINFDV
jgi:hypothetical protein